MSSHRLYPLFDFGPFAIQLDLSSGIIRIVLEISLRMCMAAAKGISL